MKKFLAILAACMTIAISLISCSDKNNNDSKKKNQSGSDKIANDYAETCYSKKGGETHYTLTSPDEYIEELKADDKWDSMIDDYNDLAKVRLVSYEFTVKDVKKGDELSKKALAGVESCFEKYYNIEGLEAEKGYEYKIKFQAVDKENGDKNTSIDKICVVKLDEGWKVIPCDAEFLECYAD